MNIQIVVASVCMLVTSWLPFVAIAFEANSATIEEANLHAISFLDADRGWVAGERGVILHSQDGGMTWKPQLTPSSACLVDIAMYNSQRGLAIGGATQTYTGISTGEVVITKDGGQSWEAITGYDLPRLRKMLIGVGGKCVAIGDWSPVHLTAVFVSSDGGTSWQPQTCNVVGSLLDIAGDVNDYLILSEHGEVVRFRDRADPQIVFPATEQSKRNSPHANHSWQAVAARDQRRVLAGPLGTIVSDNHGETWRAIPPTSTDSDPFVLGITESATIALWQDELWVTHDAASTVTRHVNETTEAVPHQGGSSVRALLRLDQDRGWAVGDFGMILLTRDGGRSWRTVRGGNRSPAVMMVGSTTVTIPWSILATESLQYQRRVAVTIDRSFNQGHRGDRERVIEACVNLGPASVYRSDASRNRIDAILQNAKPAVLVLDASLTTNQRATWAATALEAGCKRVIEIHPRGSQTINVASAIPAAGILASDVWFDAAARLAPGFLPPTRLSWNARYDTTGDLHASDGLASCTNNLPRYCWARSSLPSRRQLQVLQARTAEIHWIESLVASVTNVEEFKSQLAIVLPRMNEEDRTRLFTRLVALAARRERPDLYIASLEAIVNQTNPQHTSVLPDASNLSRVAALRLASIRSSSEWQKTFGAVGVPVAISQTSNPAATSRSNVDLSVQLSPFESPISPENSTIGPPNRNRDANLSSNFMSGKVQLASGQSSSSMAPSASAKPGGVDLRWEFHPAVLMVNRSSEQLQNNLLTLTESNSFASSSATANLRRIAGLPAAERWGELTNDLRLASTIFCPIAAAPPHLDGTFDEPWWVGGQSFAIDSQLAMVHLAHDDGFVYVSIDAPLLNATAVMSKERRRDTPMDDSDRYRLRLDLDRDLMTAYEFEFDAEGNTRDCCDGFPAFNPRWFIACKNADGRMRAEIAIQKSDLAANSGAHEAIWNVSLDRMDKPRSSPGLSMPSASQWLPVYVE